MQFCTRNLQIGLYSCYHLWIFLLLFVCCCTLCGWFLLYSQFLVCSFLHLFEKRLYFILFATAKTRMKFYELKNWQTQHRILYWFLITFCFKFFSTFLLLPSEYFWCIWDGTSAMLTSTKLLWKSASTITMKINWTFHVGKTIWLIHLLPVITFQRTLTKLVEVLLRWVGQSVGTKPYALSRLIQTSLCNLLNYD